ncbi:sensor histidine kinase [Corynebacterium sp. CNCTC7651]|uniref:sensor histidine kinase n=1 Tax=Corynebacterium sp. CNCTC7651 TaxID=2815361 RepID=UPI001F2AB154|nr:ATP-binding protein [Corynebacterium sp. CNCTC7651]UIZ92371.1 sensor histidine kinase [Corynebacterium sp. CNCTC7651]
MTPVLAFVLGVALTALAYPLFGRFNRWRDRNREHVDVEDSRVSTVSQLLHLAVQGSPTGIAVFNRSGRVLLSNPRAHDMSIVHDRTINPEVWDTALVAFEDLESHTIDLDLPSRATGSRIRNVSVIVKPLALTHNSYVIAYSSDESENVRMEAARRDFVANVSHELKTPVGGIALLAEALVEDPGDEELVAHFGEKLVKESHRMGDMITDLISLSKLQGAEALPEMSPVRIDDVIDDAIARNQVTAETREITLTRGAPTGLEVMGDQSLLTAAVANLVSNAINYSPNGQPVSVTQKVVRDSILLVRVTDRGIGIAPEDQKRVFERFYRVDKARSRSTGGTGLGLAIVKHVVANHGGTIKLWSRPGTGSTFTIELPIYRPAAVDPVDADVEAEAPQSPARRKD